MAVGVRSIEFVGGPFCGNSAERVIDMGSEGIIALAAQSCGVNVEFIYVTTDRVSIRGNAIVEYRGKHVVGPCEQGRSKAGE